MYCETAVSQTAGFSSTSEGGMRMVWWPEYTELRHHSANPRPQYGSRQSATCREGYSSHCSFIALSVAGNDWGSSFASSATWYTNKRAMAQ